MSTSVEQIKERLPIADLLGSYLKLEKAGKNLKGRCPFHNEKTPSFFVSPERDAYYCFGCGAKGDIFTFIQAFEGVDFFGALKLLAERTGVEIASGMQDRRNEKEPLYNCLEAATQFFESQLIECPEAKDYLKKRGLEDRSIKTWRLGWASDDWRKLYEYLKLRKFSDSEIEQAGLAKRGEARGSGLPSSLYDRFRGRIMFPIRDAVGRVVGFTGRILPRLDDGQTGKYLNSPETAVFNKSRLLYGLDLAKSAIRRFDYSIIVEGQMDLLMCHQAGFTNVVATSGTALTPEQLQMLKRLSNRVIMAFDSDKAGVNAAIKAYEVAMSLGLEVKIAEIVGGKDPADLILSDKESFKQALKDSLPIIDFVLGKVMGEKLESRKLGQAVKERVLPFIALLESNIEKSYFVKKVAQKAEIDEEAIWADLKKIKIEPSALGASTRVISAGVETNLDRADSVARRIFGVLSWQKKDLAPNFNLLVAEKAVAEIVGSADYKKWSDAEDILREASFEAEQYYRPDKLQPIFDELLLELKKEYLKKNLTVAISEMAKAERDKDFKKRDGLVIKCNQLTQELSKLK